MADAYRGKKDYTRAEQTHELLAANWPEEQGGFWFEANDLMVITHSPRRNGQHYITQAATNMALLAPIELRRTTLAQGSNVPMGISGTFIGRLRP